MLLCGARPRRAVLCALAATTFLPAAAAHAATLTPSDDVAAGGPAAAKRLVLSRRPPSPAFVRFDLGATPPAGFRAILYVYSFSASRDGLVLRPPSDPGWTQRPPGARPPRTRPPPAPPRPPPPTPRKA